MYEDNIDDSTLRVHDETETKRISPRRCAYTGCRYRGEFTGRPRATFAATETFFYLRQAVYGQHPP